MIPKIKISENIEKMTNPGFKDLYRIYSKDNHKAIADIMTIAGHQSMKRKILLFITQIICGRIKP